jgi:putative hydrolase of the HAD superfamily
VASPGQGSSVPEVAPGAESSPEAHGRIAGVDALLFDVTGTLLSLRQGVGISYADVAAAHDLELEPEDAAQAFREALEGARPLAFPGLAPDERLRAERAWWREVVWKVVQQSFKRGSRGRPGSTARTFEAFFDDLYSRFAAPEAWRVEEDAARVLGALVERGFALGALSNADSRLPGLLAGHGLAGYFRGVATSSMLGVAKPDDRAFHAAVALLGSTPESTAYVGDSPEVDGRGAERAGLLPVLLRSPVPVGVVAIGIESLIELLRLFLRPRHQVSR